VSLKPAILKPPENFEIEDCAGLNGDLQDPTGPSDALDKHSIAYEAKAVKAPMVHKFCFAQIYPHKIAPLGKKEF